MRRSPMCYASIKTYKSHEQSQREKTRVFENATKTKTRNNAKHELQKANNADSNNTSNTCVCVCLRNESKRKPKRNKHKCERKHVLEHKMSNNANNRRFPSHHHCENTSYCSLPGHHHRVNTSDSTPPLAIIIVAMQVIAAPIGPLFIIILEAFERPVKGLLKAFSARPLKTFSQRPFKGFFAKAF